ncbi:MAG: FtsX-like permease family protein [Muribaculaceae bacterium]|nr:FtsX-like permease family protein [Muribaculaceae bacterium]
MNYFRQLWYDMRHQKMMTWVSISGTAVSIFLVMVYFMVNNLKTVEVAPEQNRQRIYGGWYMHLQPTPDNPDQNFSRASGLDYSAAKTIYEGLEGVDMVAYVGNFDQSISLKEKGQIPETVVTKQVDGNYWNLFKFQFVDGMPFTEDDCVSPVNKIVLSQSLAHRLFQTTEVSGREVQSNGITYLISGVVEDVNPILQNTWADAYMTLNNEFRKNTYDEATKPLGPIKTFLLLGEDTDPETVGHQIELRYVKLNSELAKHGTKAIYHQQPYDAEMMATEISMVQTPDVARYHRVQFLIYALLLILPAVNLSSMVRGRLQRRISEIGVRRAYGAKRMDIIKQLLGENFIVTLAGGVIGLVFSLIFMSFFSSEFFPLVQISKAAFTVKMATPDLGMLFTWKSFFIALGACLILNVLTATVPAWRASLIEPAEAISKSRT